MAYREETIREARRLHGRGIRVNEIGRMLNVPRQTVSRWLMTYPPIYEDRPQIFTKARRRAVNENDGGYIYFIRESEQGRVKVGKATNVAKRLKAIQVCCPQDLTLVNYVWAENVTKLEAEIHRRLCPKNIRGEWFLLTDAEIQQLVVEISSKRPE